jgi:hypothetical protein
VILHEFHQLTVGPLCAKALATAKATYPAGEEPKLETLAQVFPK